MTPLTPDQVAQLTPQQLSSYIALLQQAQGSQGSALSTNATYGVDATKGAAAVANATGNTGIGSTLGSAASLVGGGLGVYNGINDYNNGNKVGGGLETASGANSLAAGAGYNSGAGPYLGMAADLYNGFNRANALDSNKRGAALTDAAGTAAADYFTGGLAGMAINPLLQTHAGGEFDSLKNKYDPASISFNDYYNNNAAGIASRTAQDGLSLGGAELVNHVLLHETTQELQADQDKNLLNQLGTADPVSAQLQSSWANRPSEDNYKGQTDTSQPADFVGYDSSGKWVNNGFASSRNESDLQVPDVAGADANYSTLGDSYANSTNAQKESFQQQMLDNGDWNESKGMLEFKDPSAAQSTWQSTLAEDPSKLTSAQYNINPTSSSPGTNGAPGSGLNNNLMPTPGQAENFLSQFKLPGPFQAIANGSLQPWQINAQQTFGYAPGTNLGLWPSDGSNLPLTPYANGGQSPVTATASPVTPAGTPAINRSALSSLLGSGSGNGTTPQPQEPQALPLDNLIAMQRINQVQI